MQSNSNTGKPKLYTDPELWEPTAKSFVPYSHAFSLVRHVRVVCCDPYNLQGASDK